MNIIDFLHARIDDDETIATAAYGGTIDAEWYAKEEHSRVYTGDWVTVVSADVENVRHGETAYHGLARASVNHIARHDPARVLADCKAKREILERFTPEYGMGNGYSLAAEQAIHALAKGYAEHPYYDPDWSL